MISSSRETLSEQSEDPLKDSARLKIVSKWEKTLSTEHCKTINVDLIKNKIWCPTLGPKCFIYETPYYGRTVVAGEPITKGTKLYNCIGEIYDHPTTYTVQVDDNKHINSIQGTCEYTCASCDPNCYFKLEDDVLTLVALRDIEKGEQITFNYCTTEFIMSTPFNCLCGAKNCLGYVAGFSNLPEKHRKELFPICLPHIQKRALEEGLI